MNRTHEVPAAQPTEIVLIKLPPPAPGPAFLAWIDHYGVSPLAKKLGLSRLTVQSWKRAGRYGRIPSIEAARMVIALSHDKPHKGRALTFDDVYGEVMPEIEVRKC